MARAAPKPVITTSRLRPNVAAIVVLAAVLFLIQAAYLWDFAIDDVGISYRYAAHLAGGQGLVWNPGSAPVEGYSNFLWVLILALGRFIGFDIIVTSKALGILFGIAGLVGITVLCRRVWSMQAFWWLPPILVAITPEWTAWAMSGLEIALYGLFLVLGMIALTREGRARVALLAISACGLTLTRPEGAGIGFLLIAASALLAGPGKNTRRDRSTVAIPLAALIVTALCLMAFRLWYFGHPLPNTVYAKFDLSLPSAMQVFWWAEFCAPFVAGLMWSRRLLDSHEKRGIMALCVVLLMVQILIVLPVSPVMYFLHRYQIAFLPLVVFSAPVILARLRQWRRGMAVAGVGLLVLWCAQGWPSVVKRYHLEMYVLSRQRCIVDQLRLLPGRPTLAIVDAGRIPYWTELPAIDAWGLCDEKIARAGFSPDLVLSRRPNVYVLSLDLRKGQGTSGVQLRPHLGMDVMTTKVPSFQRDYKLWKICSTGLTPATDDSTSMYYDYSIFLNVEWAKLQGIDDQLTPVTWPY